MAMGIVGLFVGAIVPSVGYKLFLAWIEGGMEHAMLQERHYAVTLEHVSVR